MKQMIIHGGKPLQGDIWIGGAKNSTVALIPASILSRTPPTRSVRWHGASLIVFAEVILMIVPLSAMSMTWHD